MDMIHDDKAFKEAAKSSTNAVVFSQLDNSKYLLCF